MRNARQKCTGLKQCEIHEKYYFSLFGKSIIVTYLLLVQCYECNVIKYNF